MKNFCDINCLKSLIKVPTYFRNHDKSTFWPHTNKSAQIYSNTAMLLKLQSFDSNWIQNGISKLKPKIIAYRDYKNFDNAKFTHDIVTPTTNLDNFGTSKSTIFNIFDRHNPIKFVLMKLPSCQKSYTQPSWRDQETYSFNIEPILTKKL